MELSIIMINYNTPELTAQAVESILKTTHQVSYEILVIDNSSERDREYRPEALPAPVKVFYGIENKGFGSACNLGAEKAEGSILLFLNSDTILHEGCLDRSLAYLRSEERIGGLGIRTLKDDGTLDHGCKRGFPTPSASLYYFLGLDKRHPESRRYGAYRQTFIREDQTAEVDAVSGSFLMMPKEVFQKVGGFDEDYFMYGEDLDLCYRIKEAGYRVVYFAGASMTHLRGQSGLSAQSKEIIYQFHYAMALFYRKHFKKKYNVFVTGAVYAGIWLKYGLTRLKSMLKRG